MAADPRRLDWTTFQEHERLDPPADLRAWVSHAWEARWDYDEPYSQLIVPYANVRLTWTYGQAEVGGVTRHHVVRELRGQGRAVGIVFRTGAFRPFLGAPVKTLTNRVVPASDVFGNLPDPDDVTMSTALELVRANLPDPDPAAAQAIAAADQLTEDTSIRRVDQLATALAMSPRTLQRLFADHIGVGPKWLIRRQRLHDVTEAMAEGRRIDWAALAADLQYSDQPHLVRDFTSIFGETPTEYAKRY